jgi:hypothetical protein
MTAETFCSAPEFQRTDARPASKITVALRTPDTPWIASVTCRAQLLQFMPPMKSFISAEISGGADGIVWRVSIFLSQ